VSASGELNGFLDSYLADLDAHRWTADFWADGLEECRKYLVQRNTVLSASSVLFRRQAYERVGGADESLVFCGDWKTWASMALTGGGISYLGEPLNYYRFHDSSVTLKSRQLGVEADEYLQVIRWILQRVTLTKATRTKLGDDLFQFWYPRVVASCVPPARRLRILRNAQAIDGHALPKLIRTALFALRASVSRRYRSLRFRF
jgi:hypothetical protein